MLAPDFEPRHPQCRDWTEKRLIAFEDEMAERFARGEIKSPLHLAGGNERSLIAIFQPIRNQDWVLCGWRSHYHCLLKGVPEQKVRNAIMAGRSISLSFPDYRVLSSAIVGGICPIAMGLAWAAKEKGLDEQIFCFVGDMSAYTGIFHECQKYAGWNHLPVHFIVENNGVSVCTSTNAAWGMKEKSRPRGEGYDYKLTRPHVGIGRHVIF
jgi:TPP-dependent pyruvate/acetoin dehydrogenase alpha subunit